MATYSVPITITMTTLTPNYRGSINDYDSTIAGRMRFTADNEVALIQITDVAPTSDEGPIALNGNQWQYWSDALGAYDDFLVPQRRLGWVKSQTAPDPTVYSAWYVLNSSGVGVGIRLHDGTAWSDIYYTKDELYTQDEVDALIAAATPGTMGQRDVFVATTSPDAGDGVDGDIHLKYLP